MSYVYMLTCTTTLTITYKAIMYYKYIVHTYHEPMIHNIYSLWLKPIYFMNI